MPQPLVAPGCSGRRKCNVDLNNLRQDRPDLNCEPQQALRITRNLQLDERVAVVWGEVGGEGAGMAGVVRI